jgi:hypothetical protein
MTAKSLFAQAETLGKLDLGDNKVYVIALPSKSNSIIVNYSSATPRISCSVSPKKHKIIVKNGHIKKTVNIQAPAMLFSGLYCDVPSDTTVMNFAVYGLNTQEKDRIWVAPYMLSNVYKDGRICFGSLNPKNLRAAYNLFWTAPFNSELIEEGLGVSRSVGGDVYSHNVENFVKKYRKGVYSEQPWEDATDKICGRNFWASPRGAAGVVMTNNQRLLKKIPRKHWRRYKNQPIFIARVTKIRDGWNFFSGSVKFKLAEKNVMLNTSRRYDFDEDDFPF